MNIRMKMIRAVELEADSDAFYSAAKAFGDRAAQALGRTKRAQITGLESMANSSHKVSDILDYLKLRTARQKEWQQGDLGKDLIQYLERDLRRTRQHVCADQELSTLDPFQQQEVYIMLIRAFVAHLVAQYEFACLEGGEEL
jgi:hypothetical protein